ncbi:hypothetical protein HID58_007362, partial [Brassica napus]
AHRHLLPSLLLGPTPSHSILRNSLQVGETLPIKGQSLFHNHHPHPSYNNRNLVLNVKRGGGLIGVDMLLLDSKVIPRHSCQEVHHLTTYRRHLKAGSMFSLSGFDVSLVNRTGFPNSRRTLKVSKSKSPAWPSQHKYPASSDVSGTLSMFDSDAIDPNASWNTYNTIDLQASAGLSRHWEHIISFTAEGLVLCLLLQMYKEALADDLIFYLATCSNTNAVGLLRYTHQQLIYILNILFYVSCGTTIADEIAESLFVDFNGKMHILVRAYRWRGRKSRGHTATPFIAQIVGKTCTF